MQAILNLDEQAITTVISKSVQIKIDIVEQDEREQGVRALLNLGHTFGHGLESATQYQHYLHGEAVAIGLLAAAMLASRLHGFALANVQRIRALLQAYQLPTMINHELCVSDIMSHMAMDKKVLNNSMRYILPKSIGECSIYDDISPLQVEAVLRELGAR